MSRLSLTTRLAGERTVIEDLSFSSPLKIAKPFYREDHTGIMMMCASPGMLDGDEYAVTLDMGAGTSTVFTGQSCLKIHPSMGGCCRQDVEVTVGEAASFVYMPLPVIPFPGSRFRSRTRVHLAASSRFLYFDAVQAGRWGEAFSFAEYDTHVRVSVAGRPAFTDRTRLVPAESDVGGIGFFEGRFCQGMLYGYGHPVPAMPQACDVDAAVSVAREGFCVRILGDGADQVFTFAKEAMRLVLKGNVPDAMIQDSVQAGQVSGRPKSFTLQTLSI